MPHLRTILSLNAASCLGFGVLFLLSPQAVAAFLGTPPAPSGGVTGLGVLLVINGLHLIHTSRKTLPAKSLVLYFSGGDFAWVLGTAALVVSGHWINQPGGQVAAVVVAAFVGAMGGMQIAARKALCNGQ